MTCVWNWNLFRTCWKNAGNFKKFRSSNRWVWSKFLNPHFAVRLCFLCPIMFEQIDKEILNILQRPWFSRLIFIDHYKRSCAWVSSENDCSFSNLVWLLDFIQFLSLEVERENFLETVFFIESDSRTMPLLRSTN